MCTTRRDGDICASRGMYQHTCINTVLCHRQDRATTQYVLQTMLQPRVSCLTFHARAQLITESASDPGNTCRSSAAFQGSIDANAADDSAPESLTCNITADTARAAAASPGIANATRNLTVFGCVDPAMDQLLADGEVRCPTYTIPPTFPQHFSDCRPKNHPRK